MNRKLTEGKEWKLILLFALPIMAGQLLQQLYNTVDGIVVGNYVSSDALAAVGSCNTLSFVFLALAMGMSNGSGVVVSQLFGARRMEEMRRAASTALIMLFALGVFFTLLGIFSAGFIMDRILCITDEEINHQAAVYFRIYSVGLLFQFIYNAVAAILRSIGDSKATLYFLLVSTVANIILDILLVAVIPWGVAGAAIATVFSQAACAAVSFVYMSKRYEAFRFKLRDMIFDKEKFIVCLKMGIPTSAQQLVISCGSLLLQRLVNSFGAITMSAYTVGVRFDNYISVPVMGFFTGMAAFAGQNTGAGRPDRIKRGLFSVMLMDVAGVSVLCVLLYIFAAPLARLFGVDGEILEQSVEFMRFMAFCYPIFAAYIPFNGTFQGCGDPEHAMVTSLIALALKVVGAYGMVYFLDWGYAACWQCNLVGWSVALVYVLIHFAGGKWKNKSLVGVPEPVEE